MVVKSSSAPSSPASTTTNGSSAAADPLRRVKEDSENRVRRHKETEVEFSRLKRLLPTISSKQSVSKLDVILEAIRYIDQLQDQLIDQINDNKLSITVASDLLVEKENKRMRHRSQ